MTALADATGPLPDRGALLLWSGAALAALAAHAGLAAWALYHRPEPAMAEPAAAAVMIDLAPAPVAPPAPELDIAPETLEAPEINAPTPPEPPPPDAATAPMDPVIPEPVAAVQPEAPPSPPVVTPPEMEVPPPTPTPEPELAAVAPPMPRPERPEPPPPDEPRRVERKPEAPPPAPSQAARRTSVAAAPAPVAAAPADSSSRGASVSPAKWQSMLMAHLERRKRYPNAARARRAEGVAQVRFSIDANGNVLSAQLAQSSGHPDLDAEVLALVRRASPVPAPPPDAPRDIVAPVQFQVR